MRPIFAPSNENDDPFPARRPPTAVKRPPVNKPPLANKSSNVRSRLYELKASTAQARKTVAVNNKVEATGVQRAPAAQQRNSAKVPAAEKTTAQSAAIEVAKPLTVEEHLTAIEAAVRDALTKADADLSALASDDRQLSFSEKVLDEAAAYCDRTDAYVELLGFYREQLDLAEKLTERLAAVRQTRDAHLLAHHDATRFIFLNLLPFRRAMDEKKAEIIASVERAKKEESANPPPLKRAVEMRDAEVQVLPESLILYSPTAGILRSSTAYKVTMPPSPLLLSTMTSFHHNSHLTPTSSSSRRFGSTLGTGVGTQKRFNASAIGRAAAGGCELAPAEVSFVNCEESIQQLYNSAGRPHHSAVGGSGVKSPAGRRLKFEEFAVPAPSIFSVASMASGHVESTPLDAPYLPRISEACESPQVRSTLFNDTALRNVTALFDVSTIIRRTGQTVTMPKTPTLQDVSYNARK